MTQDSTNEFGDAIDSIFLEPLPLFNEEGSDDMSPDDEFDSAFDIPDS
jgi:hypothetical protein